MVVMFEEKVSCVVDLATGERVSQWYSRLGDARRCLKKDFHDEPRYEAMEFKINQLIRT